MLRRPGVPFQVPRVVTVTARTELYHVVPVEVAWWFISRCGFPTGGWVLVLSNKAQLVAGLVIRAAAGMNLVWGIHETDVEAADELQPYAAEAQRLITICDGLPPIKWTQVGPL